MRYHYEDAPEYQGAYKANGWGDGIAWSVDGWETEPDEETEWSGYENRTGKLVAHMIGDDKLFTFEPDDLEPIEEDEYCYECGQIGCTATNV